ncbi:MAG: NTP transferase domain-containing protein [Actinobacteria bacterium]|nr:NTP transferase domain-containing protein [Actinomycetota bacterium]
MITAIVLGGGQLKEQSLPKSLIEFQGSPLIVRITEALEKSSYVSSIILIVPDEVRNSVDGKFSKVKAFVSSGKDLIEKIYEALDYVDTEYVLIMPVDVPFINEEVIDGFILECLEKKGDAFYPIISKQVIEKRFPGTKRTYGKLKEGTFTGGNVFLIKKSLFYLNRNFIEEIYAARKNAFKMARVAGIGIFLKGLLGILRIRDAEKRVSKLFNNAELKAVITKYPEIGIDVDKIEDLEMLKKLERVGSNA